jgi:hypothetical protein
MNKRNILSAFVALWLITGVLLAQVPNTYVNPCDNDENGGNGDKSSGADITVALQWCFDNYATNGHRPIKLPAGVFNISSTVTAPYVSGFTFLGSGVTVVNSPYRGIGTLINWTGDADDVAFQFTGTEHEIGNFAMYDADGASNGTIGIMVDKPTGETDLGTGYYMFRPLYFYGFGTAMQMKEDKVSQNGNVDNMEVEYLICWYCDTAYKVNGVQSMDHKIHKLNVYEGTGVEITSKGGGQLKVLSGLFGGPDCTVLKIAHGGVGNSNGHFAMYDIKIDDSVDDTTLVMLDDTCRDVHKVVFRDCLVSEDNFDGTWGTITGKGQLVIDGCQSSFKSIVGTRAQVDGAGAFYTPTVRIINSTIEVDPSKIFSGDVNYRLLNNTDQSGNFHKDYFGGDRLYDNQILRPSNN